MRKQTKIAALVSAAALLAIGASMTSFAVPGWNTNADGSYEYHDSDDIAVTDEWRTGTSSRDGKTYYYYLDSDGKMATDKLIESGEHLYYVNADGERVASYWYKVENTEGVTVNEIEPEYLYYYFDTKGQAVKGVNKGAYKTNNDPNNTETAKYCFDDDYHMVSGWYTVDGTTYYCNGETDGHMELDWAELEIPQTDVDNGEPYEEDATYAWYHFSDKGVRETPGRHYLKYNGKNYWFEFDSNGRLFEEKFGDATNNNSGKKYYYVDGGYAATGWVEADYDNGADPSTHDKTYFYFENGAAFNYNGLDALENQGIATASANNANVTDINVMIYKWDEDNGKFVNVDTTDATTGVTTYRAYKYAARIVDGKTYLFNEYGEYQTGVYKIVGTVYRKGSSQPIGDGIYYFDLVSGGPKGSMKTKKDSVTNQFDVTRNYLFKSNGQAVTSQISGGILYDKDGLRVDSTEGTWEIVEIKYDGQYTSDKADVNKTNGDKYKFQAGEKIVVNASGRVKESGTVVIDGTKYYIKNVSKGVKWDSVSEKYSKRRTTKVYNTTSKANEVAADVKGDTYVIVHQHAVD